ncbi:ribonuclease E/G [Rhodovibrionaceae bacterium A322]
MADRPSAAQLLLSRLPGETRAAWLDEQGGLLAYRLQRDDRPAVAGDLYKVRIQALDPVQRAAFVSLGGDESGFLPFDKKQRYQEGQSVVVRVSRAAAEDKGARLVLVKDEALLATLEGEATATAPCRLKEGDDLFDWVSRDGQPEQSAVLPSADAVVSDDLSLFQDLQQRFADQPDFLARLTLHKGQSPLFEPQLSAELEALLEPEVPLPGGGHLLIEPVRTLTAVDVNAGNRHAARGKTLSATVNEAALAVLVQQIRLRDLSGQILVDFLQPDSRKEKQVLAERLDAVLSAEPEPCQLERLNPGGLAEITRRRSRPPLHELLSVRAGRGGGGWQDSPLAIAFSLLRQVKAAGAQARMTLEVSSAVEREFKGSASAAFKQLNAARGGGVRLVRVPGLSDEQSNLRLGT